eukprot:CAMPEP_0184672464 /NCGR_PEP_ID=MMETSP0308-20130426/86109_1 /TAXON_ID=38269 /ORGANISM="Gloeochaete witrockiana, Strain SAG 46.84" /LENGTH=569 /DNA_ID=CAMNT_0027119795 /DNA_START=175 /DNA_END=1884 /DNA_ORIENTATION=+
MQFELKRKSKIFRVVDASTVVEDQLKICFINRSKLHAKITIRKMDTQSSAEQRKEEVLPTSTVTSSTLANGTKALQDDLERALAAIESSQLGLESRRKELTDRVLDVFRQIISTAQDTEQKILFDIASVCDGKLTNLIQHKAEIASLLAEAKKKKEEVSFTAVGNAGVAGSLSAWLTDLRTQAAALIGRLPSSEEETSGTEVHLSLNVEEPINAIRSCARVYSGPKMVTQESDPNLDHSSSDAVIPSKDTAIKFLFREPVDTDSNKGESHALSISSDAKFVAVGRQRDDMSLSESGGEREFFVQVWDVVSGRVIRTLTGHRNWIWGLSISSDGTRIASGGTDKSIRVWNLKSGDLVGTLENLESGVHDVSISGGGRCVAFGSTDVVVRVWDIEKDIVTALQGEGGHTCQCYSLSISYDGTQVASGGYDGKVRVWDIESGVVLRELVGHTGGVYSVSMSRDGGRIVSGGMDKTIRLWDVSDGRTASEIRVVDGYSGVWHSVTITGDGKFFAASTEDNKVRVWEVETGRVCAEVPIGGAVYKTRVSISSEGALIAVLNSEYQLAFWEKEDG